MKKKKKKFTSVPAAGRGMPVVAVFVELYTVECTPYYVRKAPVCVIT
jgi:hypothetical protein